MNSKLHMTTAIPSVCATVLVCMYIPGQWYCQNSCDHHDDIHGHMWHACMML